MTNIKGKAKRTVSLTGRRRRATDGVRSDFKKAYVKLAKGASLPIFAAIEESEEKDQAIQEQMEKALEKQRQAETKKSAKTPRNAGAVTRIFKKQGDK